LSLGLLERECCFFLSLDLGLLERECWHKFLGHGVSSLDLLEIDAGAVVSVLELSLVGSVTEEKLLKLWICHRRETFSRCCLWICHRRKTFLVVFGCVTEELFSFSFLVVFGSVTEEELFLVVFGSVTEEELFLVVFGSVTGEGLFLVVV